MEFKLTEESFVKAFVIYIILIIILPVLLVTFSAIATQFSTPEGDVLGPHRANGNFVCTFTEKRGSSNFKDYCSFAELFSTTISNYIMAYIFTIVFIFSNLAKYPLITIVLFIIGNILIFLCLMILVTLLEKRKQKNKL